MKFIAVLDFKNLDNPVFLKSFAESLRQMGPQQGIILHSDSAYTDRLMQTGMMRETAKLRSLQDLNHRLVSFFSDYGLACIGVHGFQKNAIVDKGNTLEINTHFFDKLPPNTHIILSALVGETDTTIKKAVTTGIIANALRQTFNIEHIYLFHTSNESNILVSNGKSSPETIFFSPETQTELPESFPTESAGFDPPYFICKPIYNNNLREFILTHKILRKSPKDD